jgi:hypothetical protein
LIEIGFDGSLFWIKSTPLGKNDDTIRILTAILVSEGIIWSARAQKKN